jgi:TnpA family transposase
MTANSAVYAHIAPVLTRVIDWDLITQHYDPMVHYATALRLVSRCTKN